MMSKRNRANFRVALSLSSLALSVCQVEVVSAEKIGGNKNGNI
jgi:hypothetical protein